MFGNKTPISAALWYSEEGEGSHDHHREPFALEGWILEI